MAQRVKRSSDPWQPRRELLALGASSLAAAVVGGMPVMANLAVCQARGIKGNGGIKGGVA